MMDLPNILKKIVANPEANNYFLSTLAHLETQGYQKLVKFRRLFQMTEPDFLRHLGDEARHSSYLNGLSKANPSSRQLNAHTRNYLTILEIFILRGLKLRKLPDFKLPYLLLTFVIERRAEILYPLYERELRDAGSLWTFGPIIEDEILHLEMIESEIEHWNIDKTFKGELINYEEQMFRRLVQ